MNNLSIKFKFLYAIVIFLASSVANSCVMVDIEALPDNKIKIVSFHTQKQALLRYEITDLNNELGRKRPFYNFFSQVCFFTDKEVNYSVGYNPDGSLNIEAPEGIANEPSKENYIVLSSKSIQSNVGLAGYNLNLKKYYWVATLIIERSPDQISQMIYGMKDKQKNAPSFVLTISGDANIKTLVGMHKDDKGILGEMLTRNTMFSFGYLYLPSVYKSNNGLDGIFISNSNAFMFLTQSKAGDTQLMAPKLVEKELNEPHIHKRLLLMKINKSQEIVQSFNVVADFLKNRPASIYKLGNTLFGCGFADLCIKPFDIQAFPKEGFSLFNAAPEEKVKAVATTLKSLAESPVEQLSLALSSINLANSPKKDSMSAMMAKIELSAEQRAAILRIMDAE